MDVTFQKPADGRHFPAWVARKGRSRISGSIVVSDTRPRRRPHDIVTLVVERQLGLTDGFFATVEAGGTFRSMTKRRHAAGKAAIARNRSGLRQAEHLVGKAWADWLSGRPSSCTAALDQAWVAWKAVPPGGLLTLTWPTHAPHGEHGRRRRGGSRRVSGARALRLARSGLLGLEGGSGHEHEK